MKKFLILLLTFIMLLSTVAFTVSAEEDFTMKEFDKAYITFVFDDGNMPFTEQCYNLFKKHNLPVCFSIIANKVKNNPQLISILKDTEKMGGEVLSHTYSHSAFNEYSGVEDFEYQLGESFLLLRALGFNVNGVIEAGNGGGEAKANYELMETVTRKYYKYSNAYGVSPQYKKKRTWLSYANDKYAFAKATIDDAIAKKEWVVFAAHSFNEIPYEDLDKILTYLKEKGNEQVEVVNWNYIYTNFGEYKGPLVPTKQSLAAVTKYKKQLEADALKEQNNNNSNNNSSSNNNYTPSEDSSISNQNSSVASSTVSDSTSDKTETSSAASSDSTTIGATINSTNNNYYSTNVTQKTTKKNISKNTIWLAVGIVAATIIICAVAIFIALKFRNKMR